MFKILLVDDDEKYLNSLNRILSLQHDVMMTNSAKEGVNLCGENRFDLIIVDLYMEEMSGIVFSELIQSLFPPQKIVILSGTTSIQDKLEVLDCNILDYIDKSTEPEVLVKRVERILQKETPVNKLYSKKADLVVDLESRMVHNDGEATRLPNKEFNLLAFFLSNKNVVLSREDIYEYLWGKALYTSNLRIVDVHVLKLRQKFDLKCLHTERGVGYIWEE